MLETLSPESFFTSSNLKIDREIESEKQVLSRELGAVTAKLHGSGVSYSSGVEWQCINITLETVKKYSSSGLPSIKMLLKRIILRLMSNL